MVRYINTKKVFYLLISKTYIDMAVQTLMTMLRQFSTNNPTSIAQSGMELGRQGQDAALRRQISFPGRIEIIQQ